MLAGDQLEQLVLRAVGVLVLVDEDVAERRAVAVADLGEQPQHVDRTAQQIVEVHRVHPVQFGLVQLERVGDRLLEVAADELPVIGGVAQLVLGGGDLMLDGRGREALDVDPEIIEAALDQAPAVGLVVDRELPGPSDMPTPWVLIG